MQEMGRPQLTAEDDVTIDGLLDDDSLRDWLRSGLFLLYLVLDLVGLADGALEDGLLTVGGAIDERRGGRVDAGQRRKPERCHDADLLRNQ